MAFIAADLQAQLQTQLLLPVYAADSSKRHLHQPARVRCNPAQRRSLQVLKTLNQRRQRKFKLKPLAVIDPELHKVLELASDNELAELSEILYGRSLISPVFKSVAPGDGSSITSSFGNMHQDDDEGRDEMLDRLESRLLFLAADAKSTVMGRRPRYRHVLLQVRRKLQVPCSAKLSTENLEAEIFLFLLQQYSNTRQKQLEEPQISKTLSWKQSIVQALKFGSNELMTAVFKGGSAVTVSTFQRLLTREVSGEVIAASARYQLSKEALKKGLASKLESYVAMLSAREVLSGAAARYMTIRTTMMVIGPVLWGTFLADMVLTALGTDYARIVRAVYALAQIRLTRTYGWTNVPKAPAIEEVSAAFLVASFLVHFLLLLLPLLCFFLVSFILLVAALPVLSCLIRYLLQTTVVCPRIHKLETWDSTQLKSETYLEQDNESNQSRRMFALTARNRRKTKPEALKENAQFCHFM